MEEAMSCIFHYEKYPASFVSCELSWSEFCHLSHFSVFCISCNIYILHKKSIKSYPIYLRKMISLLEDRQKQRPCINENNSLVYKRTFGPNFVLEAFKIISVLDKSSSK